MLANILAILNIALSALLIGLVSYRTYINYVVAKALKKDLKDKIDNYGK